jgi:8-amino-7-oxononanoate synthase
MLGSNSYLGLTTHPEVKQASLEALNKYGTGNAGSRFLNGTLDIHEQLEQQLALLTGKEAALLAGTGWMANVGTISALVGPHDIIFCDRMNHSSIIDGALLALNKKTIKYKHNNMQNLEEHIIRAIERYPDAGLLIITDGVFSMEGDIVNLPELIRIKKKYKARLIVDDAHAIGVLGENGSGTGAHFNLMKEIDLLTVTFSKSLASLGGAVIGDEKIINYLKHHSRTVIFSASMTPASVASTLKALEIMQKEPERMKRLWDIVKRMSYEFKRLGFDIGVSQTPIIPILTGSMKNTFQFWKDLTQESIFVNPVVSPAVPEGQGLIRTSYMATHKDSQLDKVLSVFEKIGKALWII